MIIFIQNVPETVSQKELDDFISEGLRRVRIFPYFAKGTLETCDVLRIRDGERVEYHGLAFIEGERAGRALIRHLRGWRLGGESVALRQYLVRSKNRDRRMLSADNQELAIVDRRRGERRRDNLLIETVYGAELPSAPSAP